jgi:predicted nucleotidyltransferase
MKEIILDKLKGLESKHDIRVLLAIESGSRAWGFESKDSDYDCRFIYAHKRDWYLRVDSDKQRDVVEYPIDEVLDILGWDLKKSLQLLMKSNSVIIEWLNSPIVYSQNDSFAKELRELAKGFSARVCYYHYQHMAKRNYEAIQIEKPRLKKYFYVLRPLLACHWLSEGRGVVPMEFKTLVDTLVPDATLKNQIFELVKAKSQSSEKDLAPQNMGLIKEFIDQQLPLLDANKITENRTLQIEDANKLFLKYL